MTPRTRRILEFVLDNLVWFMLLFVLAIFSLFIPNYFQLGIFANIIEASSVLGVMSIGLALVIMTGNMDLSVESVAALGAMAVGILFCSAGIGMGLTLQPAWLLAPASLLVALAVGGLIGSINGVLIENYLDWMKSCYYITVTSHTAISVPAGFTKEGLPVGLQIVGRYRDDFGVLQLAHAFEAATQAWKRRPPLA